MKTYALFTTVLTLCFAAPECGKQGTSLPPQEAAQARRAIVNYLECEECESGEIEAVVKLGQVAVPTLAATLFEGPPQTSVEIYRRNLTARYRELKEYERTHPEAKVPGSEQEYVASYAGNYIAGYRVRAARALATIGGPEARRALDEASRLSLRQDVGSAVKVAMEMIK